MTSEELETQIWDFFKHWRGQDEHGINFFSISKLTIQIKTRIDRTAYYYRIVVRLKIKYFCGSR
jgi:hypothetical protein